MSISYDAKISVKFKAYFNFTKSSARSIPLIKQNSYIYSSDSIVSDVIILTGLFLHLYEIHKDNFGLLYKNYKKNQKTKR